MFAIDGGRDIDFLSRIFDKLLVNFTWWVNREDADGSNLFEGGFLGLDNIGPIDRSHLPVGRHARAVRRHRLDGVRTRCSMAAIAVDPEPARPRRRPTWCSSSSSTSPLIARRDRAAGPVGRRGRLLLRPARARPTAPSCRCEVRSMVGILPLLAVAVIDEQVLAARADGGQAVRAHARPTGTSASSAHAGRGPRARRARRAAAAARRGRASSTCCGSSTRLFDEDEFLSPLRAAGAVRAATASTPTTLDVDGVRRDDRLRAGRVDHRRCSAATRTGAARSGSRSTTSSSAPLERYAPLLRRRRHDRVPDRLGAAAARSTRSPTTSARRLDLALPRRRGRPAARASAGSSGCRHDPALEGQPRSSTSTSTATTAPGLGASHQTGWTGHRRRPDPAQRRRRHPDARPS